MSPRQLIGYADRLSAGPGETVRFMVSTDHPEYRVDFVRLICGDDRGPGFKEQLIQPASFPALPGHLQVSNIGSYIIVEDSGPLNELEELTLAVWMFPTIPEGGQEQGILGAWNEKECSGYLLFVQGDGRLTLRMGYQGRAHSLATAERLRPRRWHFVAASVGGSPSREASLRVYSEGPETETPTWSLVQGCFPGLSLPEPDTPFLLGACHHDKREAHGTFNGKLDTPRIFSKALSNPEIQSLAASSSERPECKDSVGHGSVVAAWDFAASPGQELIQDRGPHGLTGRTVNLPTRAVTGRNWTGEVLDWRMRPWEYAAIHFHDDDLGDADWSVGFEWRVPEVPSGVYAARLTAGGELDHIPVIIRPRPRVPVPVGRALLIFPTLTYLAYANFRGHSEADGPTRSPESTGPKDPLDRHLDSHPEYGKSLYDSHADGSGCSLTTRLRPIINMRPSYRTWYVNGLRHFAADLYLVDWLEQMGHSYDVITDDELDSEGDSLLPDYDVVLTGSHPEYATVGMLDSLQRYVNEGGNLMYLGGNGYYWVTSFGGERREYAEVRRGMAGTRPWESPPGETHHATTGEPGGHWRYRGRSPNTLVGVGMAALGGGAGIGYTRTAESFDPQVAWIFEGVCADTDQPVGDFGLCLDAAAGDEVDRADQKLGTPTSAIVLATACGFSNHYQVVVEDVLQLTGGTGGPDNKNVRADMVIVESAAGGRVFSVGSISWCGSLSHNEYDNAVSRITGNVLRTFLAQSGRSSRRRHEHGS